MAAAHRMDVYCIGEMLIDFIPGEEPHSYIRTAGGSPANVAIGCARNGVVSGMCCSVGADDFGDFLIDTLRSNGVRRLLRRRAENAVTTMAFVTLHDDGVPSFTFVRKPGADMFVHPDDVRIDEIERCKLVHAGSCSLSASPCREAVHRALQLGHDNEKLVSFEVSYRDFIWDGDRTACANAIFEILPKIDLLKMAGDEMDLFGGVENLPSLMEQHNISVIAVNSGAEGVEIFFSGKQISIPGFPTTNVVDQTGAGDAFWAGFLSYLRLRGIENTEQLTEDLVRDAATYGNAAASVCVQKKGAVPSLPTREQTEQQLVRRAMAGRA